MFEGRIGAAAPALLVVGLLAIGSAHAASTCVRECANAKRQCVKDGRTTALACKQDCRAITEPTALGDCMRGCSADFRDTKGTCRAAFKLCKSGCVSGTTTSTVQGTTTSSTVSPTTTTSSTLPTSPSAAFAD
jgi:hypothetical protein